MKTISCLMLLFTLFISCARHNQGSDLASSGKKPSVRVKDWGIMKILLLDEIWKNAEAEIVSQIGTSEFDSVKKKYDYRSVPPAMSIATAENRRNKQKYFEKLSELKLYKIASFSERAKGKEWGRLAILEVPYKGNEEWDVNVKWDTVYFIVPELAIEQ